MAKHEAVTLVRGDLLDAELCKRTFAGHDFVFHFAANADVRDGLKHPRKDVEQNTLVTHNVLEACRANDIKDLAFSSTGVSLTRGELAQAAGISDDDLGRLEEYGLVAPSHTTKDRVLFDEDALAVARVCGTFMQHGIEPRHLRMYRAFADREASLFDQVLLPYRRQRNPEAQARSTETLGELAGLGRRLRTALLRQAVRRDFNG